jgi:hypothetical protein
MGEYGNNILENRRESEEESEGEMLYSMGLSGVG